MKIKKKAKPKKNSKQKPKTKTKQDDIFSNKETQAKAKKAEGDKFRI